MNSKLWGIDLKDLGNAVANGAFIAVIGFLYQTSQTASFDVTSLDWGQVLNYAIIGAVGALAKRFSTDDQGKVFGAIKL